MMTQLKLIYEALRDEGLCGTQAEFSREWLGRSKHYMSSIGGDPRRASLTSLHLLASRLELATIKAKAAANRSAYRNLRSAFVSACTLYNGVFELRHLPTFYRVTALT